MRLRTRDAVRDEVREAMCRCGWGGAGAMCRGGGHVVQGLRIMQAQRCNVASNRKQSGAMKIRSRNNTVHNAWGIRAPAAPAQKRHFGIGEEVPFDLSAEVICRAEAAQGPRVIEFSSDVRMSSAGRCYTDCVAQVSSEVLDCFFG